MNFIYPRISNALAYKSLGEGIVVVSDCLSGEVYEFTDEAVEYIQQLDMHMI